MEQYQISTDNVELASAIRTGQLQQSFLNYQQQGKNILVSENTQFKKQLQSDIEQHFVFMLRASFFSGVFEEITTFVNKYESQFQQSIKLFANWKSIDELLEKTQKDIVWAETQLILIEEYKRSGVTHQQYNEDRDNFFQSMLNKDFMRVAAMDNATKAAERARVEAQASTTKIEAEFHLSWLQQQQQGQQEFQLALDQITKNWNSDYETYLGGKEFVNKVNEAQFSLFNEKSWHSGSLGQQLQTQRAIANPYFHRLYQQYLICFKFQLDLNELFELVDNKKKVKEIIIEIAQRNAWKPTVLAFIKHWQDELRDANHKLQNLENHDKLQRMMEFARNANRSFHKIENGFQDLHLSVSKEQRTIKVYSGAEYDDGKYVTKVKLEKPDLNLHYIDPDDIQYSQETLQQQEVVREIHRHIQHWQEELAKLERCQQVLQDLQAQPPLIRGKYAYIYEQESLGGQTLVLQFKELLELSLKEDYNELYYKRERMPCLLGALSDRLVIKKNACCMCCSRQKMHEADNLYFEDYEKSIAAEVRRLTNAENKWFTSASERIQSADKLPAVKTTCQLMSNNYILAALRNDNGQRQVSKGVRNFNVYESIVLTINELCQLIVVEEKKRLNMSSQTIDAKINRWQRLLAEAQSGQKAQNRIVPVNK